MAKKNDSKGTREFIGGSGKMHVFQDGGHVINLMIKLEDLIGSSDGKVKPLPVSEKGYIRIVLGERKEPDQFKNTHYIYKDTFVPKKKDDAPKGDSGDDKDDDMPF
jgi:hypothetical protein